jgi:glycerol-3-phosphate acyltransferase PlsY
MRTTGRTAGILTLLLDGSKGYLAVWLAGRLTDGNALWMSAAALAVMIGHAYPIYLRFKGGKAVASCVGAFLCLAPAAMAAVLVVFVATVAWTRHISMGSIIAAATLPLAIWIIDRGPLSATVAAAAAAGLVIYRHRSNITRLRAGTENVFTFGARK